MSVSTVSLVLSGKGRISTATGERVNAAIEELGFVRNRQASALRGGQSGVIGLIVRDLSAPFYAELTAGLTEALEAQGRMVFLLHGGKDGEQLAQRFSLLLNQGVDGVVIAGAAGSSDDLRRMAEEKAIPVIFASRASYLDDVDTVRPDNMQAAQLLTEHLIRNGHQRIAWLGGQSSSLTRAEPVSYTHLIHYNFTKPLKPIKARDIRPAVINAMALPRKGAGTSATARRSRMAAKRTITSEKPTAAEKPYSADCKKLCPRLIFSNATPSTAQLVVISGKKIPSRR